MGEGSPLGNVKRRLDAQGEAFTRDVYLIARACNRRFVERFSLVMTNARSARDEVELVAVEPNLECHADELGEGDGAPLPADGELLIGADLVERISALVD